MFRSLRRPAPPAAAVAVLAVLAALLLPADGAGAADPCIAWGALPARVVLGPHGVTVRTTLRGTAGCRGITTDNGGTAVLVGPGRNNAVPLRWDRFGATDEAVYYPSLNRPGTYRVVDGRTQTYDANYERIPATWHVSATVVKYRGRFVGLHRSGAGVSATLEAYGRTGWQRQRSVPVELQRRTRGGSWPVVATARTSRSGRVFLAARMFAGADYRLVSAATGDVWGAVRTLPAPAG